MAIFMAGPLGSGGFERCVERCGERGAGGAGLPGGHAIIPAARREGQGGRARSILTVAERAFKLLNVCSAPAADDRTALARIRDAALACFAEAGVAATTVRQVAERAGVSPALVIHHYGSKAALRKACDAYVAAFLRERKSAAMRAGPGLDPLALLRPEDDRVPLLPYLARVLAEGSPEVDALVDELVADAEGYLAEGVASGTVRPHDHPHAVATVLTLWSLGGLALHRHVHRLLGVDLTAPMSQLLTASGYVGGATEILGRGLIEPAIFERLARAAAAAPDATEEEA
jgi:AcrR family transcriptional regulator